MKTLLTLKSGSFFFLPSVSLVRNQTKEVNLEDLSPKDIKKVKSQVSRGLMTSTEKLDDYIKGEITEALEEALDLLESTPTAPELEQEAVTEDPVEVTDDEVILELDYSDMLVKDLKTEISNRGLETDATIKADLIKVLIADDNK